MKDRHGFTFEELVEIQTADLAKWERLLRPEIYEGVCAYVQATNQRAASADDKHRVFRGQDLVGIIREWPHLSAIWPEAPTADDVI